MNFTHVPNPAFGNAKHPLKFGNVSKDKTLVVNTLVAEAAQDSVILSSIKKEAPSKTDLSLQVSEVQAQQKRANPIEKQYLIAKETWLTASIKLMEAEEKAVKTNAPADVMFVEAMEKLVAQYELWTTQTEIAKVFSDNNPDQLSVVLSRLEKHGKAMKKLKQKAGQEMANLKALQPKQFEYAKLQAVLQAIKNELDAIMLTENPDTEKAGKLFSALPKLKNEIQALDQQVGGFKNLEAQQLAWGLREVLASRKPFQVMQYLEKISEQSGQNWLLSTRENIISTPEGNVLETLRQKDLSLDNGLSVTVQHILKTREGQPSADMPEQVIVTINNPVYKEKPDDTTDEFYRFTPGFGVESGFYNAEQAVSAGAYYHMVSLFDTALPAMTSKEVKALAVDDDMSELKMLFKGGKISVKDIDVIVKKLEASGRKFYEKNNIAQSKSVPYRHNIKQGAFESGVTINVETYYLPLDTEDETMTKPVGFRLTVGRPGQFDPVQYLDAHVKDNGVFEHGGEQSQSDMSDFVKVALETIPTRPAAKIKMKTL